jgi:DNA segregation ATPase FtsK/SpoIIIE, S-DNA-T family
MTYSLNTLNATRNSRQQPVRPGLARFTDELKLLAGLLVMALWLLSLFTYSPLDMAWSTSGTGAPTLNQAGRLGAWLADGSYFVV